MSCWTSTTIFFLDFCDSFESFVIIIISYNEHLIFSYNYLDKLLLKLKRVGKHLTSYYYLCLKILNIKINIKRS